MTTTPKIGAPELAVGQASKEATHNESLRYLEQGGRFYVIKDKDLTTPPGSPADGDAYIVAANGGPWSAFAAKDIAFYMSTGWLKVTPEEGVFAWMQDENLLYYYNGSAWAAYTATAGGGLLAANNLSDVANAATAGANIRPVESLIIAVGDETTAITTGTAKVTFRMPYGFTLTDVRASLNTVSSSGIPTVDINEAGTTILSTKLTIDASEKTSVTAATPVVISDTSLADDAEMTIDIDTAGTGAKGLKVVLIGHRT